MPQLTHVRDRGVEFWFGGADTAVPPDPPGTTSDARFTVAFLGEVRPTDTVLVRYRLNGHQSHVRLGRQRTVQGPDGRPVTIHSGALTGLKHGAKVSYGIVFERLTPHGIVRVPESADAYPYEFVFAQPVLGVGPESNADLPRLVGHLNGNGYANGHSNGHANDTARASDPPAPPTPGAGRPTTGAAPQRKSGEELAVRGGRKAVTEPIPWLGYGSDQIGQEEETYLLQAIRSKRLNRNEHHPDSNSFCMRLEMAMEEYFGVKHVYLLPSATVGMSLSLHALGIGPGDEVIVPSFEWITGATSVINCGAVPIIAQIDESLGLDPVDTERKITPRTKALMIAHVLGYPCNMHALKDLAWKHNLAIIEDVAQAPGGTLHGRKLGTFGDVACFSFHAAKLISTGDGGCIATDRDDIYEWIFSYVDAFALPSRKQHLNPTEIPHVSGRVNELMAAVGLAQFERLPKVLEKLRAARDIIYEGVRDCKRFRIAMSHDREGECGVQVMMVFPSQADAELFEQALEAEGVPMCFTSRTGFYKGAAEYRYLAQATRVRKSVLQDNAMLSAFWHAMQDRISIHPANNPWKHPEYIKRGGGDVVYNGVADIGHTLDILSKVVILRLNPHMNAGHAHMIAAAIRKVDALL